LHFWAAARPQTPNPKPKTETRRRREQCTTQKAVGVGGWCLVFGWWVCSDGWAWSAGQANLICRKSSKTAANRSEPNNAQNFHQDRHVILKTLEKFGLKKNKRGMRIEKGFDYAAIV